jgi:hypothetical protein
MASFLKSDPTLAFDFLAKAGTRAIIFVENDAGSVQFESADLNGTDVPVGADGKITTPNFQAGLAVLSFTINVVLAGDQVRVKEDCGGGVTQLLKTFTFDGDPLKRYEIDVS